MPTTRQIRRAWDALANVVSSKVNNAVLEDLCQLKDDDFGRIGTSGATMKVSVVVTTDDHTLIATDVEVVLPPELFADA